MPNALSDTQNTNLQQTRAHGSLFTVISRTMIIAFMAFVLQGCELDDGNDNNSDDEDTIVYSTNSGTDTITNDDTYELILRANNTFLILEDNLSEISIQGDSNFLIIDSDTNIEEISITGDDNIITVEDDVNLTVEQLTIQGNGNSVTVFEIGTFTETSDADETANLACEISENGSCL